MRFLNGLALAVKVMLVAFSAVPIVAVALDAVTLEPIEVTSSKLPVTLRDAPATVTVVSGDELRARGARDLRTALSQVAGVAIAPGGDAGGRFGRSIPLGLARI